MIKTTTVTLYERTQISVDSFGAPIYETVPVEVPGVLVTPVSAEAIVTDLQLYGKRAEYELCLPKNDTHDWTNVKVSFFGRTFRTFGTEIHYIDANVPLKWNTKVKVEAYG